MYIWIAIAAYMLYALNGVADKFLLSKAVRDPAVYAFYIGITGSLTWFLVPFGFQMLGPFDFVLALLAGASFVVALYYNYSAIQQTSISRVLPIMGGLVPIFTLGLSYVILGERLDGEQLWAFVFLVVGAVLISLRKDRRGWHPKALKNSLLAAILFALSLTLTKLIFDKTNFVSGLIWTRLGFLLVSVLFLLAKRTRRNIFAAPRETSRGNIFLYYGARLSGGLAGLLQNYAIAIGSVTFVNAMQGSQYALLLVTTVFLSKYYPEILKEKIRGWILAQKILAILLISVGLYFLTLG